MKNIIKKICIWYLTRHEPATLKNIEITSSKFAFEFGGYLPDDKNWHHVSMSLSCWLKLTGEKHDALFDEVGIYSDGEHKAGYHFDVPEPKISPTQ